MDWMGILKGSLVSVIGLGLALHLLRKARASAMRERNRTTLIRREAMAWCHGGNGHFVRRDWCSWDGQHDGKARWICHLHRLERKRDAWTDKGVA